LLEKGQDAVERVIKYVLKAEHAVIVIRSRKKLAKIPNFRKYPSG